LSYDKPEKLPPFTYITYLIFPIKKIFEKRGILLRKKESSATSFFCRVLPLIIE